MLDLLGVSLLGDGRGVTMTVIPFRHVALRRVFPLRSLVSSLELVCRIDSSLGSIWFLTLKGRCGSCGLVPS